MNGKFNPTDHVPPLGTLPTRNPGRRWRSDAIKRLFDIAFAAAGLVVLAPVAFLISLAIKMSDGGPVYYRQIRIGQYGRPFSILKFRSMIVNADRVGLAVTRGGDTRVTWIGRWLRRTKLDEIPQLWNVLAGDMSFVGPRPESPKYVDYYTPKQREILDYKPGITDLASIRFRNEEALLHGAANVEDFYVRHCLPRKIELNRRYGENSTLWKDIWIILETIFPYWLGVLTVYSGALTAALWCAYQLRFDFAVAPASYAELRHCLPLMAIPQLVLLLWCGQFRGLMSYFSVPEMRRVVAALTGAMVIQFALWYASAGRLAPSRAIIIIHALLSFVALCGIRMTLRMCRERFVSVKPRSARRPWRIAIVGTGSLATKLALDIINDPNRGAVVAFFGDDSNVWHTRPHDIPVVGMPECLLHSEWQDRVDEVVLALGDESATRRREIGEMLKSIPLKVTAVSSWPVLKAAVV